jgi:hypothetical protein
MKDVGSHIQILLFFLLLDFRGFSQEALGPKATVDRNKILIGEPIQLNLEARIPNGSAFHWFLLDSLPHFDLVDKGNLDSSSIADQMLYHQRVTITSFDSGSVYIPGLMMEIGGKQIYTDSILIEVGYSPFDPNKDYHDIKDIINVENPYVRYIIWGIGLISLLSLIAVIYFVRKHPSQVMRPRAPTIKLTPYEEAKNALDELKREKLPEQGLVKLYYTRLNDILRVFVLHKLNMSSLEKTNEELIMQLRQLNISPHQFSQLSSALRMSDFVKFAKYLPDQFSNEQNFEIIESSVNLLNEFEE